MFATALISKWACHLEASGKGSFPVMPAWLTTSFCPAESSHLPIVSAISEEVKTQIRHHLRSGAGYRDFASYDLGGQPIKAWTSPTYTLSRRFGYKAVASRIGLAPPAARPPSIALQPDMRPGFCWPFSGASGHLAIRLSQPIRIHNVSVEHIRAELVRDVTTAPRTFVLWAVVKPHDVQALEGRRTMEVAPSKLLTRALPRSASLLPLAQFDYNINSDEQVQTFPLDDTTLRLNLTSQAVVFQVLTNWGSKENTCLYRVRVHGEP